MKKKVATLEVWYDDETTHPETGGPFVSHLETNVQNGELQPFKLVVNPAADHQWLAEKPLANDRAKFASIIAHELGHFVAILMKSKWQTVLQAFDRLPGEREAWNIAHYINPNINAEVKQLALASYEDDRPQMFREVADEIFEETKVL
jgi:hypothetical protein